MRPYKTADVGTVRAISRPFLHAHGEPVAWGDSAAESLGIADLDRPDFGDPSEIGPGEVPVFWGCGVTPSLVAMDSKIPGEVIFHAPGFMLVLDIEGAPKGAESCNT